MTTTRHLVVSIKGLEDRLKASKPDSTHGFWKVLSDENGRYLTYGEVWAEIKRCKKLGYTVIPTCDKVDKRGMCRGHVSHNGGSKS